MLLTLPKLQFNTKWLASEKSDSCLSTFVGTYLLMDTINMFVQDVLLLSGGTYTLFRAGMMGVLALVLFVALYVQEKRVAYSFIFVEAFALLPYLYSILVGSSLGKMGDWIVTGLAICWPIAFCTYHVKDKNVLYKRLLQFSWAVLLFAFLTMKFSNNVKKSIYNMHFSYAMLFVVLMHANDFLRTKKIVYLAAVPFEFYALLNFGSRGALACIAAFILLKAVIAVKDVRVRVLCLVGGGLFLGISAYIINNYGPQIFQWIRTNLFYSRTLRMLLTGELSSTKGRNQLWIDTVASIFNKPLFGWGIRGATSVIDHPYPHQFFYDLWLTFGIPIGSLLCLVILWPLRKIFYYDGSKESDLLQIFFSIAFVYLQFSGTLFTSYYFFIMMGLALSSSCKMVSVNEKMKKEDSSL